MKALLFDLDGTVADTEPFHLEALKRMLRRHGAGGDLADFHSRVSGRTSADVAADFFPEADAATLRARIAAKESLFRDLAHDIAPTPGLIRLLDDAARQGLRTGLVTNAPRDNLDFLLERLGLNGRFDTVVVAGELARAKPDPLPYWTALANLSVAAGDALAFEDSLPGIRSATQAGLRCVGMTTSLPGGALLAAGACAVMADFSAFALSDHDDVTAFCH